MLWDICLIRVTSDNLFSQFCWVFSALESQALKYSGIYFDFPLICSQYWPFLARQISPYYLHNLSNQMDQEPRAAPASSASPSDSTSNPQSQHNRVSSRSCHACHTKKIRCD